MSVVNGYGQQMPFCCEPEAHIKSMGLRTGIGIVFAVSSWNFESSQEQQVRKTDKFLVILQEYDVNFCAVLLYLPTRDERIYKQDVNMRLAFLFSSFFSY